MSREGEASIGADNGKESVARVGRESVARAGRGAVAALCWLQEWLLLVPVGSWLGRVGTRGGGLGGPRAVCLVLTGEPMAGMWGGENGQVFVCPVKSDLGFYLRVSTPPVCISGVAGALWVSGSGTSCARGRRRLPDLTSPRG